MNQRMTNDELKQVPWSPTLCFHVFPVASRFVLAAVLKHGRGGVRWTMYGGQWTVDGGLCMVYNARCAVDGGRWTVDGGWQTIHT